MHEKKYIILLFTHPHDIQNLADFIFNENILKFFFFFFCCFLYNECRWGLDLAPSRMDKKIP